MSLHRFFATGDLSRDTDVPVALPLSAEDIHHLVNVLRMRPGERVAVVEPGGAAFEVALAALQRDAVTGQVVRELPRTREFDITLVQGLTKGVKFELVVEKCVEIGVAAVWPVEFARSVSRPDAERGARKAERWRRIAAAASAQSGRSAVPAVADPVAFPDLLARLADFDAVLVCWEEAGDPAPGIGEALEALGATSDSKVAVVVGPEGGLTPEEVAALRRAGGVTVTLGDTVLRSETAGILSVALCVYGLGGLGGRPRG